MEWISVKDRLPDIKGIYWAFPTDDAKGYCAMYWNGSSFSRGGRINLLVREGDSQRVYSPPKVTHWMDIELMYPESPKD